MKKLIVFIVLLSSLSVIAQERTYTYIGNRYEWLAGVFRALGLPAGDGPAAFEPGQRQRAGAVYYDSVGVDSGLYVYTGLYWQKQGGSIVIPGEGMTESNDSLHFAGLIGSPGVFFNERTVNVNRKIMHWTNGIPSEAGGALWQFSNRPYSPFQFISQDTVTSTGQVLSLNRPLSGLYARRTVYLNAGVYRADEKLYGHYAGLIYSFADSMTAYTAGGDYYQPLHAEYRIQPRNNGRQVLRTGHGTGTNLRRQEGLAAFVANMYLDGKDNASTDTLKINGTVVGMRPYLVAALGSGKIDIDNVVYYEAGALLNANARVRKSYILAPSVPYGSVTDSAFLIFDTTRVARSFIAGDVQIGHSTTWSSTDKLKVGGNANITDSLIVGKATNIADTTGYDIVLRKRTDGSLMRITSTQLSGFLGSLTVDPPGSGNANGLEISGSTIKSHYAGSSSPGIVSTSTQSFTGNKTFNDIVTVGDELRAQLNIRLRDASASGFYVYLQSNPLTANKNHIFADDDPNNDTIATRGWARANISGGSGSGTVNNGNQYRIAYYATTGTAVSEAAAITANRALISDANGVPTHATTTATEIGYVNGVTSAIQTQIDNIKSEGLSKRRWYVAPSSATNVVTVGTNAVTTSGTVANPTITNTNLLTSTRRFTLQTAASLAAAARMNNTSTEVWMGDAAGLGGFSAVFRFATSVTAAGNRCFVGFANTVSALSNVDHFTNTAIDRVGMYIDANTGNWNLIHNTSGSAATTIALGANFPVDNTSLYELTLITLPNSGSISYVVKNLSTGNSTSGTMSSNLPTASNFLAAHTWINTNSGSTAITLDVARVFVETNY